MAVFTGIGCVSIGIPRACFDGPITFPESVGWSRQKKKVSLFVLALSGLIQL